jgi:hypothetical protein
MYNAEMDLPEFELSMVRSIIFFVQNRLQSITVDNITRPVKVMASFPYEQFEDYTNQGALVTIDATRIMQEGFMIGTEIPYTPTGNQIEDVRSPFRYDIQFTIQTYAKSAIERLKLDGKLMKIFLNLGKGGIPVLEFIADTSSVSAFDTGTSIIMTGINQITRASAEDIRQHDYMTNWTVNAKCNYIYQTITVLVTSLSLDSTIFFNNTG